MSENITRWIKLDKEFAQAKKELLPLGDKNAIKNEVRTLENKIKELTQKSGLTPEEVKVYQDITYANAEIQKEIIGLTSDKNEILRLISYLQQLSFIIDGSINFSTTNAFVLDVFSKFKDLLKSLVTQESKNLEISLIQYQSELFSKESELNSRLIENQKLLTPILEKNKIQGEIKSIETSIVTEKKKLTIIEAKEKEIEELKINRDQNLFIDHYANIIKSYNDLKDEINKRISAKWGDEQTKLTLTASSIFDNIKFVESLSSAINVRSYLENQFENCGFKGSTYNFEESTHISCITSILNICISDNDRFNNFKLGHNTEDLLRALLKDCSYLDFDIKKGDDSIRNMSEGKKGIVILQLYLSLSKADYPILIDQPEDNLDNRTVYIELNDYIKKCKERRQIIMVSHNANLVVNTDAENIIVANQMGEDGKDNKEFKFEYVNGALENTFEDDKAKGILFRKGIREHVCEILEGGTDAFKKREEKYHLSR